MTFIDSAVVATYFIAMGLFGFAVRRGTSFSGFSVAGRRVPAMMVAASLCATYIGPGYSLSLSGRAVSTGFFMLPLFLLFSVQTIVSGIWLAPRLQQHSGAHTIGEVLESWYGRPVKVIVGALSVALCTGIAGLLARVGGQILATSFGWHLSVGILIVTGVGLLYVFTGGLKAVVLTEAAQFIVILAATAALALATWSQLPSISQAASETVAKTNAAFREAGWLNYGALAVTFFFGEMLLPPYANRALASDTQSSSVRGFVWAGIFAATWFLVMVALGSVAPSFLAEPGSAGADTTLLDLANSVLPAGLNGLFFVAIAAIVMSTQESLLNAGAVSFVRDLIPNRSRSEKAELVVARITTVLLASIGIIVAFISPGILRGLLMAYAVWAPTVLPVLLWGLLGKKTVKIVGLSSCFAGLITSVITVITVPGDRGAALGTVLGLFAAGIAALGAASLNRREMPGQGART